MSFLVLEEHRKGGGVTRLLRRFFHKPLSAPSARSIILVLGNSRIRIVAALAVHEIEGVLRNVAETIGEPDCPSVFRRACYDRRLIGEEHIGERLPAFVWFGRIRKWNAALIVLDVV